MKKGLLKGFTLIELMVVVAIIAILTAIAVANYNVARSKSRDAKRISDIAQIRLALEMYFDKCDSYPILLQLGPQVLAGHDLCPGVSLGNFMSVIPTPPPNAGETSYQYQWHSGSSYVADDYLIATKLENYNSVLSDDADMNTAASTDPSNTGWINWHNDPSINGTCDTYVAIYCPNPSFIYDLTSKNN